MVLFPDGVDHQPAPGARFRSASTTGLPDRRRVDDGGQASGRPVHRVPGPDSSQLHGKLSFGLASCKDEHLGVRQVMADHLQNQVARSAEPGQSKRFAVLRFVSRRDRYPMAPAQRRGAASASEKMAGIGKANAFGNSHELGVPTVHIPSRSPESGAEISSPLWQ